MQQNGSLYMHIYFTKSGFQPDPKRKGQYRRLATVYATRSKYILEPAVIQSCIMYQLLGSAFALKCMAVFVGVLLTKPKMKFLLFSTPRQDLPCQTRANLKKSLLSRSYNVFIFTSLPSFPVLNKFKRRKFQKTKNLLTGETEADPEMIKVRTYCFAFWLLLSSL